MTLTPTYEDIEGLELTDGNFWIFSDSRTDEFNCNLVTVYSSTINILISMFASLISCIIYIL